MTAINWKTGTSGQWSDAADWSTGTVPGASDSVTIAAAPAVSGQSYAVTLASSASVSAITLDQSAATLYAENGTLSVAKTFALEAGTLTLSNETLQGGAYTNTGGTVLCQNVTLTGVTWDGALSLVWPSNFRTSLAMNGVTFQGSNGSGSGSLSLSNYDLYLQQSSFSSVNIALANTEIDGNTGSLTLAPSVQVTTIGASDSYFDFATSIDNQGIIASSSGGELNFEAATFDNGGTITASNGGSVIVGYEGSASITNTGLISVGSGGLVELSTSGTSGSILNSGSITVAAGGTLALDASQTTAQLKSTATCLGTLEILGTVTNSGATLTTSSTLANIVLDGGSIIGGTILNTGNFSAQVGTLSGITLNGALDVDGPSGTGSYGTSLYISGAVFTGATGSGGATLSVASGAVDFLQNQIVSSGSITLGSTLNTANIEAGGYGEAIATTLTLGPGLALTQTAGSAGLLVENGQDSIVNDGTISVSGTSATINLLDLANAGTLALSNGASGAWAGDGSATVTNSGTVLVNGATLTLGAYIDYSSYSGNLDNTGLLSISGTSSSFYPGSSLANSGTISLSSGAALQLGYDSQTWSNTGTILVSASTLSVGGSFTAATLGNVELDNGGILRIAGTFTNTGTVSAGSGTIALLSGGSIVGGTIVNTSGGFVASGGTLSGVAFDGNINLNTNTSSLTIAGGLAMSGASGSGPGTISATGTATTLTLLGSQTLSNTDLGLAGAILLADQTSGATTVTLSTTSALLATSNTQISGSDTYKNGTYTPTGDTLISNGAINDISANGILGFNNLNIKNTGTMTVANGAQVSVYAGTLTNSGTVSLSGTSSTISFSSYGGTNGFINAGIVTIGTGSSLSLAGSSLAWSNTGTIQVAGGDLVLGGTFTSKQLGTIQNSAGGTVAIQGTLNNAGTLSLGSGKALSSLTLLSSGEISGGKIIDAGGGLLTNGGTLSGVTYDGTLSLAASNARLTLVKGLTMSGSGGTGNGIVLLAGSNSTLYLSGSQSLVGTVLDIGAVTTNGNFASNSISFEDTTSGATTLALGAASSINQVGANATIQGQTTYNGNTYGPTGDTIQSAGSISTTLAGNSLDLSAVNLKNTGHMTIENGATIDIEQGSLTNAGIILISASGTNAYGNLESAQIAFGQDNDDGDYTEGFANTGLVTIGAGGLLDLDNPSYTGTSSLNWTNAGGRIAVSGGTLQFGGTFTTAELGTITLTNGGSATIDGDGHLNNTAATLTVGGTSALSAISLQGTIQGGTIIDQGNGIVFQTGYNDDNGQPFQGVLNDVAYQGVLTIGAAAETAEIIGGISLTGTNGSGTGSIALTGAGATLDFASTESLASAVVSIGNASASSTLTGSGLTLAASASIQQTGAQATIGSSGQTLSSITNAGTIVAAQSAGTLTLAGKFANSGTVAVSNGETLVLDTTALTNTGTISVTNGLLDVGNVTAAQLTEITLANSPLAVTGTLTASGSTLTVGTGSALPAIELSGTILGGTITDTGNGVGFYGNATLNGVTYKGALIVNRPLASLTIVNGLTAESANGALPGSITLTGAGSRIVWDSAQALNNATVSIGNAGTTYEGKLVLAPSIVASYLYPVTLGASLTINQTGTYADIGGNSYGDTSGGTVTSAAKINATFAGGTMTLEGNAFTNTGTIAVSNTGTVTVGAANFINTGAILVGAGSTLDLNLYNYFADTSFAAQSFGNIGSITLAGGTISELTDGGTFPTVPLLNAAGANISGFGTIASAIDNAGTVTATTGTLTLGQPITGSGALVVDANATLVLSSVSTGETASFGGAGGMLGLSPASFLGEIGGFASGDTIDLASTTATAAAFSTNSIVVTLSTGSTLHLATTSALTGTLTATAGLHGDTLITFATAQTHAPFEPPTARVEPTPPLEPAGMPAAYTPADAWLIPHMT